MIISYLRIHFLGFMAMKVITGFANDTVQPPTALTLTEPSAYRMQFWAATQMTVARLRWRSPPPRGETEAVPQSRPGAALL